MDLKYEIGQLLSTAISELTQEEIMSILEVPGRMEMGDYAFPCFRLAKVYRKAPPQIAQELIEKIPASPFIKRVEAVNGYINFFMNPAPFISHVLTSVLEQREKYGSSIMGEGKNIVIDYSAPNIAKPFHIGHLRSTVIGNALYQIHAFLGYNCIGINHLGDWGTQFGKLIVAYKKWGSKEEIEEKGIQELNHLYVKFHEEAEQNPELEEEARGWFTKMEHGDEGALSLWKWFKEISLKEFNRVYDLLGVSFDSYAGESFYNDKMEPIIQELKDKKLLEKSEGAEIVDLSEEDMPPCLITKKDGSTLYATRDITAAIYRKNTYDFTRCIYITALEQNLHFAQWFTVIRKMGYDWHDKLVHVPFGMVSMETGKLSTRKGNVILLEDILKESIEKTKAIIEEKNPNLENKEETAKAVGIGAIIFNDLYNNRIKDIVFSWDKILNFDGETGPYVQYTHARACSVLKKAEVKEQNLEEVAFELLDDDASIQVCKVLEGFPKVIQEAAERLEPSLLSRHIMDLAQAFNKFYHECPILIAEEEIKRARLALVESVQIVLQNGLRLLGIDAPKQM
ncbi:MAG: arginine--tRNA ligase [Epulopiscium sp.]|nr:arginine--tRNA ligase [Candidatus Epulonipiscium sp.]